jgi:hypothetical protein
VGIPTLVVTSKERRVDRGYKQMFWGAKAKSEYDDRPDVHVEHNYIKDFLMEDVVPGASEERGHMENICLFFIRELLAWCTSGKSVDSLLVHDGVPVHVAESEAERYLDMFKNASPIEDTIVQLTDEPTLAGMAIKDEQSKLLAGADTDFSKHRLRTLVDFGSTTMASEFEEMRKRRICVS